MEWVQNMDHQILLWIADTLRGVWMTRIQYILSTINNHGEIWLLIALILLVRPKTRRCGMAMLLALLMGLLAGNLILKPWVARPRPFLTYTDIAALLHPGGFSFPSGHTVSSFCAATTCFGYFRRAGIGCYVLAALIGFSRLYLGVHYPTDVLCGAVLGILLGAAAVWLIERVCDSIHFQRIRR